MTHVARSVIAKLVVVVTGISFAILSPAMAKGPKKPGAFIQEADPNGESLQKKCIYLKYRRATDVAAAITDYIGRELSTNSRPTLYQRQLDQSTVTSEPLTNSLTISGSPGGCESIAQIVQMIDEPPPEIVIQVLVAERDRATGRLKITSRPQIWAYNDRKSLIGIFYVPRFDFVVTAKTAPEGKIVIHVKPQLSQATTAYSLPLDNGQTSTAVNITKSDAVLTAHDGETVAIEGVARVQTANVEEIKIPWLSALPRIGELFRYSVRTTTHSELLVILTPHVVRGWSEADRKLNEEAVKIDHFLSDHCDSIESRQRQVMILPPLSGSRKDGPISTWGS